MINLQINLDVERYKYRVPQFKGIPTMYCMCFEIKIARIFYDALLFWRSSSGFSQYPKVEGKQTLDQDLKKDRR